MSKTRRFDRLRGSRVGAGVSVTAVAFAATLIIQIASIPIFLYAVGTEGWAAWLVLSAIPSYLSLSDLGFSGVAVTRATHLRAEKRPEQAVGVYQAAWVLVVSLGLLVGIILSIAGPYAVADSIALPIPFLEIAAIFAFLSGSTVTVLHLGFVEGAFRAVHQFPRGMSWVIAARVAEFVAYVVTVLITHSLLSTAVAGFLVRLTVTAAATMDAKKTAAWFQFSIAFPNPAVLRGIVGPSLSYSGMSVGAALVNQGMTLVINSRLGPEALVLYNTVRTAVNSIQQALTVITIGTLAELTHALASRETRRAQRLHRLSHVSGTLLTVLGGIALCVLGPTIIDVWTQGQVDPGFTFLVLMVLTTVADTPWRVNLNTLRGVNAHTSTALAFVTACLIALLAAYWTLPRYGLVAAPVALLVIDILCVPMSILAVRRVWRALQSGGPDVISTSTDRLRD